ncbi:MAG: hypothetical protein ICV69_08635 [Thermoleophilaceae bacterium]|nr:hypothetical protein [Thermoleophilaceae bacterium]
MCLLSALLGAGGAAAIAGLTSVGAQQRSGQAESEGASGGLLFVQNARGGRLVQVKGRKYRLLLRGVDDHALYFTDRPKRIAGTLTVRELLKALGFHTGTPHPNAVLNVFTRRGQDALPIELMNPRYRRAKNSLAFTVRKLPSSAEPVRGVTPRHRALDRFGNRLDRSVARRFGRTALFIDDGGHTCEFYLNNDSGTTLNLHDYGAWDTDTWHDRPSGFGPGVMHWESDGGFFRGCSNWVTFSTDSGAMFTIRTYDPWDGPNMVKCEAWGNVQTYYCSGHEKDSWNSDNLVGIGAVCSNTQRVCEDPARATIASGARPASDAEE